jgi:hypothetical protein
MSIKAYCDICNKELEDKGFSFEAQKQEVITDLGSGNKALDKKLIHICKQCHDKHLAKLYGTKEKK